VQRVDRAHHRAARVDHVVVDDADLAVDVADEGRDLGLVVLRTALVHDGQVGAEHVGELLGGLGASHVGADDAELLTLEVLGLVVVGEDRQRCQVVHRDVEKALNLALVQVDGHDAVDAGRLQQVGDELGRDGLARGSLAVLARVAVVRKHCRDGARGRTLGGVDHDEELHQRIVDLRSRDGLHDEHVHAAHALQIARVDLAVGELLQLDVAQRDSQLVGDGVREFGVRRPREQRHALLGVRGECCHESS
jgi:hypothetical protein